MIAVQPSSGIIPHPSASPSTYWPTHFVPDPPPPVIKTCTVSFASYPLLSTIVARAPAKEVLDALIATPSLIEAADGYGRTPVIVACLYGTAETVELLIKLGASLKARSRDARTPLIHAARRGEARIVEMLVKAGADRDVRDNVGFDAFFSALVCGHSDLLPALRPEGDINAIIEARIRFADVFAQVASIHGFRRACSLAETFAALGGNISSDGLHSPPPLAYAIERNDHNALVELVRLGANVNCYSERFNRVVNTKCSGPMFAALNSAWDTFIERLKENSKGTLISLLPPDMLRLIVGYLRPRRSEKPPGPVRDVPVIEEVD